MSNVPRALPVMARLYHREPASPVARDVRSLGRSSRCEVLPRAPKDEGRITSGNAERRPLEDIATPMSAALRSAGIPEPAALAS